MLDHGSSGLSRESINVTGRQRCKWCGWVTLLACLGVLKLMVAATLQTYHDQSDDAFINLSQSKDNYFLASKRTSEARKRKGHKLSWKYEGPWSDKCTKDLHELIDEKDLDWPTNRPLPEFKDNGKRGGGVIVFWHLAKTGGTSVRKRCATLPGVDYLLLVKPEDYYRGTDIIADYLIPRQELDSVDAFDHRHNHTLFVELHGMNAPTVLDLQDQMKYWRTLSEKHNTPLFIFTLLREPVAYSVSYFNFFHQNVTEMPSDKDLEKVSFNRQCHTLAASPGYNARICALLYKKLNILFDWVGTTEKMSEETLPLLQHLLRFKPAQEKFVDDNATSFLLPTSSQRKRYNEAVPRKFSIDRESISPATIQGIRDRTCLDRGLWERARKDYTLDIFEDNIERRLT
jgi:hypothetical protein